MSLFLFGLIVGLAGGWGLAAWMFNAPAIEEEKQQRERRVLVSARNFTDFCEPAVRGLLGSAAQRIGVALDAAICFGVLEYQDGNRSLQDREAVAAKYEDNVRRLKTWRYPSGH